MKKFSVKKLALAGMFCALCVVGSVFSFPMFGSKCAPVQHMVNVLCAVLLGPWWGVGVAFVASLLRNILGLGSLMAFPGSMFGALLRGLDVRLRDETGGSVNVSPTALDNVVNGCARVLEANAFDGGFVQTNA